MPGVKLEIASEALQRGIKETFEELKITFVNRNWMEIIAVKS